MKKSISFGILLFLTSLFIGSTVFADNPKKNKKKQEKEQKIEKVKNIVESQNYTFVAQRASSLTFPDKQLTGVTYDLKITKDTIVAYLPYFGRAYSATAVDRPGLTNGIEFISTNFMYELNKEKKGGWKATIKIKDQPIFGYEMTLTIGESGGASLYVNDNTRESITFTGDIRIE